MRYTEDEILQFVEEEDVKFIRLAFCDVFGNQKNVSIMPTELKRAFSSGIPINAALVKGFGDNTLSDLFLRPDLGTLSILPWRPEHGRVVRMFCSVTNADGSIFENDTRTILVNAAKAASEMGLSFKISTKMEFYLFKLDENGEKTNIPYDNAGYMDMAPDDKGENVRREICLTLEQMGIIPERSHHEAGPGQNEIDFESSDALSAADNAMAFALVVRTVAARNGLFADFSPKPIEGKPGNGVHIKLNIKSKDGENKTAQIISGILNYAEDMTLFLNPSEDSYKRLGSFSAPKYVAWADKNLSQLIRVPQDGLDAKQLVLRSADPTVNPYLAFALLIYAGLEGIEKNMELPPMAEVFLNSAPKEIAEKYRTLPPTLKDAKEKAKASEFVNKYLPKTLIETYCE